MQREPLTSRVRGQWPRVAAALATAIAAGRWPPGTLLPDRQALAAEFGLDPTTMGRALAHLATRGVIERVRGRRRPYRVVGAAPRAINWGPGAVDPAWAAPWCETVEAEVVVPPPDVAAAFREAGPLFRWRYRLGDGPQVVVVGTVWWLPQSWLAGYAAHPTLGTDLVERVLQESGRVRGMVRETVSATVASPADARLWLDPAPATVVVLLLHRQVEDREGRCVEWAELAGRATRVAWTVTRPAPAGPTADAGHQDAPAG